MNCMKQGYCSVLMQGHIALKNCEFKGKKIYRGYYTAVRRYEFYLLVVKTIFHSFAHLQPQSFYYIVVNNIKPQSVIFIFDR